MAKLDISKVVERVTRILVTLKFVRPLLGTVASPDVFEKHQIDKARAAGVSEEKIQQEVEALRAQVAAMTPTEREEFMKRGGTIFPKDKDGRGGLCMKDHQLMGFLKNAGDVRRSTAEEEVPEEGAPKKRGTKWGSIRSKIDKYVKIDEQTCALYRVANGIKAQVMQANGYEVRPLRAQTAQGPRVSLVCSERLDANDPVYVDFTLSIMEGAPIDLDMIVEMLKYGERCGMLQWRNAGFGRFETQIEFDDVVECKYCAIND